MMGSAQLRTALVSWLVFFAGVFSLVFVLACNERMQTPTSATAASAPVSAPPPAAPPTASTQPVVDAPSTNVGPQLPADGPLNYSFRPDHVAFWNHSSVDKLVTVACFQVLSSSEQRLVTPWIFATIGAGRMYQAVDYDYSSAGCGATVQCDSNPGNAPFDWRHAQYKPGVLFTTPACAATPPPSSPPTPPPPTTPACVDPTFPAWPAAAASTFTVKPPTPKCEWVTRKRSRTKCDGTVETDTRQIQVCK